LSKKNAFKTWKIFFIVLKGVSKTFPDRQFIAKHCYVVNKNFKVIEVANCDLKINSLPNAAVILFFYHLTTLLPHRTPSLIKEGVKDKDT